MKFNIGGSLVDGVEIDGVNRTITFNPVGSGESEVEFTDEPFGIMRIFLPQNADTSFATHGRSLEGDFLNTLPEIDNDYIIDLLEAFNPNSSNLNEILIDLKTDQQKIYEIIGKLQVGGFYPVDSGLTNGTTIYFNHYNQSSTIQEFLDTIENEVRNATDGFAEP